MNRLFWKILLGFWLTQVLTAAGAGYAVHWYHELQRKAAQQSTQTLAGNFMTDMLATVIRHEGEAGVKRLLAECEHSHCPPVFVLDDQGRDLLGRASLPELQHDEQPGAMQHATAPNGRVYSIFDAGPGFSPGSRHGYDGPPPPPMHGRQPHSPNAIGVPPFPVIHMIVALVTSLLFSGAFAWYLTRPILHLRNASQRLAEGRLATRVLPLLGGRKDEIAELGKDFDYMATRLQSLVGAQTQLLHDVSHELRSPLARLRLAIGLAHQQPDRFEAATERIERESERLDVLLGKILTLSRLDSGFHGEKSIFNLTELLVETVQDADFEAQSGKKRVVFEANGDVLVNGYPELMHRVLENIIRNGVKYTADGTAVTVLMHVQNGMVSVDVLDHGPGVPQGELDDIFKPFFRSSSTSGKADGYGLGLAITKRAIEAHGGSIVICNRPEGGLSVTITLPMVSADAP